MAANRKKGRKGSGHKWGESLPQDAKRLLTGKGNGAKPKGK